MSSIYYYYDGGRGTLEHIVNLSRSRGAPLKFWTEDGFLAGTAYPNGEVQW